MLLAALEAAAVRQYCISRQLLDVCTLDTAASSHMQSDCTFHTTVVLHAMIAINSCDLIVQHCSQPPLLPEVCPTSVLVLGLPKKLSHHGVVA